MPRRKVILLLILGLVVVGVTTQIPRFLGNSSNTRRVYDHLVVTDGDTFSLSKSSISVNIRNIRPLGVDAPEKKDKYYEDATRYLTGLLGRDKRHLWIKVPEPADESLTFRRILALVYLSKQQEESVNEMILGAGWGKIYKFPAPLTNDESLRTRFLDAQVAAALAGRGIWQEKKGVFVGAIVYWGEKEIVALVNRGTEEAPLRDLILRDSNLEGKHEKDPAKPYNLLSDNSWHRTAAVVPPAGVVYISKQSGEVWNDVGDKAFLYSDHLEDPDVYSYKGPG